MTLFPLPDLPRTDLDDAALVSSLCALAAREREARADFIVQLAELDRRRLYLPAGYPSLFDWLVRRLHFSKASAYRRLTAARLFARMPAVVGYLREGRLSLAKLCLLKDVLQPEHCLALLEQAASLTEQDVAELAAVLDPRRHPAPARDSIRPVAAPRSLDLFATTAEAPTPEAPSPPSPAEVAAAAPAGSVAKPIAPAVRHVVKMTVSPEFLALLEQVRDALAHSHPGASLDTLLGECMKVTLAARRRRTRAETSSPRPAKPRARPHRSRHIPAEVRREVWRRDAARCTFVAEDGRRCDATRRLEIHHLVPFARGGEATAASLTLRCAGHNLHAARCDFGEKLVEGSIRSRRGERAARRAAGP